jgi:hypothetical protein
VGKVILDTHLSYTREGHELRERQLWLWVYKQLARADNLSGMQGGKRVLSGSKMRGETKVVQAVCGGAKCIQRLYVHV